MQAKVPGNGLATVTSYNWFKMGKNSFAHALKYSHDFGTEFTVYSNNAIFLVKL